MTATITTSENPWLASSAVLEGITPEIPGVATYHLRFRDPELQARYRFRPGQFNMLYLPGAGEMAISLSAGTDGGTTWDHTVRVAGNVSGALAALRPGGTLGVRGPFGSSWPLDSCAGADVVLVAGGIGMPPFRPAIYHLLNDRKRYGNVALLYGARSPDTLLYTSEYAAWSNARIDVQTTVDRSAPGWLGQVGVVPLLIDRLRPLTPTNAVLMLCGPEVMIRYSVRSALQRGLGKDQIWISLERNMQCAVGLCGHCMLGPEFVCKNGPVFRYDQIEPFLNVEAL